MTRWDSPRMDLLGKKISSCSWSLNPWSFKRSLLRSHRETSSWLRTAPMVDLAVVLPLKCTLGLLSRAFLLWLHEKLATPKRRLNGPNARKLGSSVDSGLHWKNQWVTQVGGAVTPCSVSYWSHRESVFAVSWIAAVSEQKVIFVLCCVCSFCRLYRWASKSSQILWLILLCPARPEYASNLSYWFHNVAASGYWSLCSNHSNRVCSTCASTEIIGQSITSYKAKPFLHDMIIASYHSELKDVNTVCCLAFYLRLKEGKVGNIIKAGRSLTSDNASV